MKKRGFVVMLLLVIMVSSAALAEITYFSVVEIPTGTRTPLMDWAPITHHPCTGIYVRHYMFGEYGNLASNYFTIGINGYENSGVGGTWIPPDTAKIIQSSSLRGATSYRVIMRTNIDEGLGFARIAGYAEPLH